MDSKDNKIIIYQDENGLRKFQFVLPMKICGLRRRNSQKFMTRRNRISVSILMGFIPTANSTAKQLTRNSC